MGRLKLWFNSRCKQARTRRDKIMEEEKEWLPTRLWHAYAGKCMYCNAFDRLEVLPATLDIKPHRSASLILQHIELFHYADENGKWIVHFHHHCNLHHHMSPLGYSNKGRIPDSSTLTRKRNIYLLPTQLQVTTTTTQLILSPPVLQSAANSAPALWSQGMISLRIHAVIVHHVVALRPLHGCILLGAEPGAGLWRRCLAAAWRSIRRAPSNDEPGEPCDERLVPVVDPVLASVRGPRWCIPDGSIHPHWPHRKCVFALPRIPPYRYVVHKESAGTNGYHLLQSTLQREHRSQGHTLYQV